MSLNISLRPRHRTEMACILKLPPESLSHVRLFVTPQTVTHQAFQPMGFFQARILEWVPIPFSKGSS